MIYLEWIFGIMGGITFFIAIVMVWLLGFLTLKDIWQDLKK